MRRMIDMIRSSSVSATLVQAAARGALLVPPGEMIEILVHLAVHNKVFGQQARMTLAGWDEKASLEAAADPNTSKEVLDYWIASENLRPRLLPALLENPSISSEALTVLAVSGSREVVEAMRASRRVQGAPEILHALATNANFLDGEVAPPHSEILSPDTDEASIQEESHDAHSSEDNADVDAFLSEHAKELATEGEKPFQPLGGIHEFELPSAEIVPEKTEGQPEPAAANVTKPQPSGGAATAARAAAKKVKASLGGERGSALQKISKLDVKGRIQLAMKGTKEERAILVRDGTKLVALAVLESGKITDGEVEKFASQKNVLEAVLRQIPMKRRFMKNYNVVRNLVANPRTPLDISLGLMKNILVADLRNLSSNKEVSETVRKLALKMFKQKSEPSKKSH